MSSSFRAGAAASNITPALGTSLNGGMTDRTAAHIHDELHARCLVLDDGKTRVALVTCDSCMIPTEILDEAKHLAHGHTGIPPDRMLISATHTHTAPTVAAVFQSEPCAEYADFLALRISDGIRRAQHNLAPARAGWAVGDAPRQVFNRRWRMASDAVLKDPFGGVDRVKMNPPRASERLLEPAGPIDPQVSVLGIAGADGRPLALWANYSLHYVGGAGGGDVSADYFGMFCVAVGRRLKASEGDPPFVAAMTNGTSGNINNINFREPAERQPPYAQMRRVAEEVAAVAVEAFGRIEFRDKIDLDMREARVDVGRRLPNGDEVARARFILSQGEGAPLRGLEEIYARETVLMADWPATIEAPVQALRIGELGVAALPCEVFVETGLAIKEASPLRPTFIVSLANGYAGYLPTVEHHALGGYETWRARSSFLKVEAEPKLRGKALELLSGIRA